MNKKYKPESIKNIIQEFIADEGLEELVAIGTLRNNWEDIVGKQLAPEINIISLQNGTLWLKIINPNWKTEVFLRRENLLKKINSYLQTETIKELIIK